MRFQTASRTDVGRVRKRNEDSLGFFRPTESAVLKRYGICLAVADGVGGEAHGDVASRTAIATLLKEYYQGPGDIAVQQRLKNGVAKANAAVLQASDELRSYGTATTLVAAVILADRAVIANVGDSRAYVISRPKAIARQISLDHSLVQEQVRMGILAPEEAEQAPNKNVITRALGTDPAVKVDVFEVPLVPGDTVLLCSDGLVRVVTDTEIADIVASNPISTAVDKLVALANSRGGPDNISVCAAGAVSGIATAALPVAVVAVAVMMGAALLLGGGQLVKKLAFPRPGDKVSVQVDIRSDPSGASVSINGVEVGKTPLNETVSTDTQNGSVDIAMSLDGYSDTLDSKSIADLPKSRTGLPELVLERQLILISPEQPSRVLLTVTSLPSGAKVYLDTYYIGVTPITDRMVDTGKRVLSVTLAGYQDYTKPLDLKASDEAMEVPILLTSRDPALPATASLTITSTPAGAQASLDGWDIGTTPITNRLVDPGKQRVLVLKLTGYDDYMTSLSLQAGEAKSVPVTLVKKVVIPAMGTVTITSTPEGADISVDDTSKGITPSRAVELAVGEHTIRVSLTGYQPQERKITVTAGGATPVDFKLLPQQEKDAVIGRFESEPAGAEVWIDGEDSGKTTPCEISLKPGSYVVTMRLKGYDELRKTIAVLDDGAPPPFHFDLHRTAGPDDR
jgi:serine/threonine protein phosphatase PrpC